MMCEVVARGAASLVVASVLNVPAFAQMNTAPRMLALERSAAGVVREYVATDVTARDAPVVPANIQAAVYRGLLESMLDRSPSFRQQCRRIAAAPHVTVRLQPAAGPLRRARARSRIVRSPDGALTATIEIAALADTVELIAHEIEHVIEQLDDVDLPARAGVANSGVRLGDAEEEASFETTRARRVGLKVAQEVRGGG